MGDISPTVVSLCGIALLVGVLILLAAFFLVKVARLSIFVIAMNVIRMLTEPREDPGVERAQTARPNLSRDLRSRAQSLDFDAAVARYSAQEQAQSSLVEPDPPLPPAPDLTPPPVNTSTPISGRIMRDGRYRRVTGGTPGRETDQDFRRVEGGDDDGY